MQRGCAFVLSALLLVSSSQLATAQVIYTFGTYSQNFDTLASTGTNNPWIDNATITGWYSTETSYKANDGTGNSAGLYSYGTTGSTERALGSIVSNSVPTVRFAAQLLNNSGSTIQSINLSFVGEQWRNSGGGVVDTLAFEYLVTASPTNQISAGGYTGDSNLDFTALHVAAPASALDGNLPVNQTPLNDTITGLNWGPGQFLWLRWSEIRLPNAPNNGLAIDGLTLAVPEPGVIASVGLLGLGFFAVRNLRSKKKATAPEEAEKTETASEEQPAVA
jgi:hypothetical protein